MAKKRIPKRIGGVKIPKELRRSGEALLDRAASPEGKALLAGGLSMAAAAVAAAVEKRAGARPGATGPVPPRPPEPPVPPRPPFPPEPPTPPQGIADPGAIGDAVGQAVEAILAKFVRR